MTDKFKITGNVRRNSNGSYKLENTETGKVVAWLEQWGNIQRLHVANEKEWREAGKPWAWAR